jgi:hypothetical protein
MKYLLIAVYLAHSGITPEYRTREMPNKTECQSLAERYVKQAVMGQSRAFCLPLKGVNK